ncbi:MAG: DegT/DnrJ/EryC1/StrS aminotransferase family protein, partial [Phycisphaeraceae bacterium]|nr:DegT/DnrJ/EryC1/StrS aminotransferase family protein [Phycisphaeraceae bacterium]
MNFIPLNRPDIRSHDFAALEGALQALAEDDVSPIRQLESAAAKLTDRPHAVAATTAGVALEAAMLSVGLRMGDEVICPAFAPARLVAAIVRSGGIPRFVDVDPLTGGMPSDAVEAAISDRTRAISSIAPWTAPSVLEDLAALSRKYEIPLIEDAIESLGTTMASDAAGRFGVLSVLGLGRESSAMAAGGGLIVTHDERVAATCREILTEGRAASCDPDDVDEDHEAGDHVRAGLDGRLDVLRAAIGIGALERLSETLAARREVAARYIARLGGEADLLISPPPSSVQPSWTAFPVRLDERFLIEDRDAIIKGMRRHDIGVSAAWSFGPGLPVARH